MFCLNALISAFAALACAKSCFDLVLFLSTQNPNTFLTAKLNRDVVYRATIDEAEQWKLDKKYFWDTLLAVVWDIFLSLLFVVQHRFMASDWWKNMLQKFGVVTAQRALYILTTSWILQFMMEKQEPIRGGALWYFEFGENHRLLWLVVYIGHAIAWLLLYGTCLVMDLPEMLGIKQVYYQHLGVEPPINHKSAQTRRLYDRMRHGGASCLLVILWLHPLMTWTRLVLATTLTLFMMCGFAVHDKDYIYLREQIARKRITLRLQRTKNIEILQ